MLSMRTTSQPDLSGSSSTMSRMTRSFGLIENSMPEPVINGEILVSPRRCARPSEYLQVKSGAVTGLPNNVFKGAACRTRTRHMGLASYFTAAISATTASLDLPMASSREWSVVFMATQLVEQRTAMTKRQRIS
jgi:hypothetical protein